MASELENVYLKLGIDTKQFDSSISGIRRELASLKGVAGSSILSKEESSAIDSRMRQLKGDFDDLKAATLGVDTGDVFGNLAKGGALASSAVGSVVGVTELLGVKSKNLESIQKEMMTAINISMALQQLADAKRLKSLVLEYSQMLKNAITFKNQNVLIAEQATATGTLTVAQALQTKGVGLATKAQLVWNAVMSANPLGVFLVALTAVIAGVTLLVKWMNASATAANEVNEAVNPLIDSLKEWDKQNQELAQSNQDLANELAVLNGEMTQGDADRAKAKAEYNKAMEESEKQYVESLKLLYEKDFENKDLYDQLKKGLDKKVSKEREELYTQLQLKLQKINSVEVKDKEKAEKEKTDKVKQELDKRKQANESLRNELAKGELELIKKLQEYNNELAKEGIAKQLLSGSKEAFKEFSKESSEKFNAFKKEVLDLSQLVSGSDELYAPNNKTLQNIFALQKAFEAAGQAFDENLGFYNATQYKDFLDKLTEYRDNYYEQLEKAVKKAAQDELLLEAKKNDERKSLLEKQAQLDIQAANKSVADKSLIAKKEKEIKDKLNIDKQASDLEYNKAVNRINKQFADDQEKINKEALENKVKYNRQAIEDIMTINQAGIDQLDAQLKKAVPGSKDYNNLLEGRNVLLNKQIEALILLKKVASEDINNRSDLTDEEKLRNVAIAYEDIETIIDGVKKKLNEPIQADDPWGLSQWENLDFQGKVDAVLGATQAGLQVFSDFMTAIFSAQDEALAAETEKQLDAISDYYDDTIEQIDSALKYGMISYEQYQKQKEEADAAKAAKEKEIRKKQDKEEKDHAMWQALIGTAVAVINGLQTAPFVPLGILMGVMAAALGAVQVAAIQSEPLPEYATGGFVTGNSHALGGKDINVEGGEYIVKKKAAQAPNMAPVLDSINNQTYQPGFDASLVEKFINDTIRGIVSIPVQNVESETTRVQRRVANIEKSATW